MKVVTGAETNKSIWRIAVVMNHYGNWKEKRLERKERKGTRRKGRRKKEK